MSATRSMPRGRAAAAADAGRIGLYAFLVISALFFLMPLYVMIVTSLKTHAGDPPRQHLRAAGRAEPSPPGCKAWSRACTGLTCNGIRSASSTRCAS